MSKAEKSRIRSEYIILPLIFIYRILAFVCFNLRYTKDSYEYLSRDGFAIFHGSIDRYRLPAYPLLMDLFLKVSEDNGLIFLGVFQFLVSLLSVFVLYLTLRKIVSNKIICLAVAFFYSVYDAVVIWDNTLLTESLSLSLTVFLLYGLVSFVKERKMRYVIITSLILVIGSFLRAVFAIYAGSFTGALILIMLFDRSKDKDDKASVKTCLSYVLISLMPIVLILMYAGAFYKSYNAFTLSDSYLGQQLSVVLENGYYGSSSDDELINLSESILNDTYASEEERNAVEEKTDNIIYELYGKDCSVNSIGRARFYIMETYDRERIESFVNESLGNNKTSHNQYVINNLLDKFEFSEVYYTLAYDSAVTVYFYLPIHLMISGLPDLNMNLLFTMGVSFAEVLIFALILILRKKKEWIRLGLGVYIASTVWLAVTGTNLEFARTALTALPFVFVAFALYIASLFALIRKKV